MPLPKITHNRLLMAVLIGAMTMAVAVGAAPPAAATGGGGGPQGRPVHDGLQGSTTLAQIAKVIRSDDVDQTGEGIGVAIIDTGVAPVLGLQDVVHGPDLSLDAPAPDLRHVDANGHGTHLAGIITSDNSAARGIAPDVTLVSVKVGSAHGAVDVSQVIAAIDWVVQHAEQHDIRVLLLAYGVDSTQSLRTDPLIHAVELAWEAGIVVITSAGNDEHDDAHVTSPARAPRVIAVGATDTTRSNKVRDHTVAEFSAAGDDLRHPDVFAPGVGILSAGVPGSYLGDTYPRAWRRGLLMRGHGTSQAAAVVAGAAALLLEAAPDLTPDQVKGVLMETVEELDDGNQPHEHAGVVDVRDAVEAGKKASKETREAHEDDAADDDGPDEWSFTQRPPRTTGSGSLEQARGSSHAPPGNHLGEADIFGRPFDAAAWARQAAAGTSWSGDGLWNGLSWSPEDMGQASPAPYWGALEWDGDGWDGYGWDGYGWDGYGWDGGAWTAWPWGSTAWQTVRWE